MTRESKEVVVIALLGVVLALLLVGILTKDVAAAQCCRPQQPDPTVFVETEEPLNCTNHFVQIDGYGQLVGAEYTGLIGNINARSQRISGVDLAGGVSFGNIQGQGVLGLNLRIGVAISEPGPGFDILKFTYMGGQDRATYNEAGIRVPIPYAAVVGDVRALAYVGGIAYSFYSDTKLYSGGYGLLLGFLAELCRADFSLTVWGEAQSVQHKVECTSMPNLFGFSVGVALWLF